MVAHIPGGVDFALLVGKDKQSHLEALLIIKMWKEELQTNPNLTMISPSDTIIGITNQNTKDNKTTKTILPTIGYFNGEKDPVTLQGVTIQGFTEPIPKTINNSRFFNVQQLEKNQDRFVAGASGSPFFKYSDGKLSKIPYTYVLNHELTPTFQLKTVVCLNTKILDSLKISIIKTLNALPVQQTTLASSKSTIREALESAEISNRQPTAFELENNLKLKIRQIFEPIYSQLWYGTSHLNNNRSVSPEVEIGIREELIRELDARLIDFITRFRKPDGSKLKKEEISNSLKQNLSELTHAALGNPKKILSYQKNQIETAALQKTKFSESTSQIWTHKFVQLLNHYMEYFLNNEVL